MRLVPGKDQFDLRDVPHIRQFHYKSRIKGTSVRQRSVRGIHITKYRRSNELKLTLAANSHWEKIASTLYYLVRLYRCLKLYRHSYLNYRLTSVLLATFSSKLHWLNCCLTPTRIVATIDCTNQTVSCYFNVFTYLSLLSLSSTPSQLFC